MNDSRRIIQAVMGYRAAKILLVAVSLDLFTAIEKYGGTLSRLCSALKTDRRATEVLLDSLVSLGYLSKGKGSYRNSPVSRRVLVEGRPGYIGNNLKYQELIWEAWSDLKRVVRTGQTRLPLELWLQQHKTFSGEYIRGMLNISRGPARQIAQKAAFPAARRMLDVGAGPGAYALALLERCPRLEADLLDLPSTVRVARQIVDGHPLAGRLKFIPGNYHRLAFGQGLYDLVLFSHVTHDEGEADNRRLIRKAWAALRPGGRLIVHDFMLGPDRTSPPFGALFSVHMLVYTKQGRVYSVREYRDWIEEAGFAGVKKYDIAKGSPNASIALIASRPKA